MTWITSVEALAGGVLFESRVAWLPGYATPQKVLVPAADAQASLTISGTSTPVDVFPNADGTGVPLAQPLTPDEDGRLPGYVQQPLVIDLTYSVGVAAPHTVKVGVNPLAGTAPLFPSGADDTAAINAANAAGQQLGAGTFLIAGAISCPKGQGEALTVIKATAAAACVQSGPALPAAPSNADQQPAGDFKFDGNAVATGGASHIAVLLNTVNWHYAPIKITNLPANVDAMVVAGQNDTVQKSELEATGTGFCLAFDNGAGGNLISDPRTGGGNQIEFRETVGTNGYGVPEQNTIDNWIGDQPLASTYAIRHRAGHLNVIRDSEWTNRTAAAAIKFEPNTGGYTGVRYANGSLVLEGKNSFSGAGEGVLGGEGQSFVWADFSSDGTAAAGGMADVVALWCSGVLNIAGVDQEFKWGCTTPVVGVSCALYRQPTATVRPLWVPSGTGALADANGLWRLLSSNTWAFGGLPDPALSDKLQVKTGGIRVTSNAAGAKLWSGGAGLNTWLSVGRVAEELQVGVAGGPGNYFSDTVAGDIAIRAYAGAIRMGVAAGGQNPSDVAELVVQDGAVVLNAPVNGAFVGQDPWRPTGAIAQSFTRRGKKPNTTQALVSGRLHMIGGAIVPRGRPVNHIHVVNGNVSAAGGTHCWFALFDISRNKLAVTNDDTSAAPWNAGADKGLDLAAAWIPSADTAVYVGVVVVATTMPNLIGADALAGAAFYGIAPILAGFADTGLTDPTTCPAVAAALTAVSTHSWAYLT